VRSTSVSSLFRPIGTFVARGARTILSHSDVRALGDGVQIVGEQYRVEDVRIGVAGSQFESCVTQQAAAQG
jgi:hypothetical protein